MGHHDALEKIREELLRSGATGFREKAHLNWYDSYRRCLDETGFTKYFPTVDDLTLSMGRSLHYYHGRMLENARMGNITDGFNLNGWAAPETSEDIVDVYRYPTGDPDILSYYARPLYVAVKIPDTVTRRGSPARNFFLVNESDLKGRALRCGVHGPDGATGSRNRTGDLLGARRTASFGGRGFPATVEKSGAGPVTASLRDPKGTIRATGVDDLYASLSAPAAHTASIAVIDTRAGEPLPEKTRKIAPPRSIPAPDRTSSLLARTTSARRPARTKAATSARRTRGERYDSSSSSKRTNGRTQNDLFRTRRSKFRRAVHGTDGRFIAERHPFSKVSRRGRPCTGNIRLLPRRNWGLDMARTGTETIVRPRCETADISRTRARALRHGQGIFPPSTSPGAEIGETVFPPRQGCSQHDGEGDETGIRSVVYGLAVQTPGSLPSSSQ